MILWHSWHAVATLRVIVPASTLPKLLRVSRACTPPTLSIMTSRISLSLPMATSYLLTLGSPKSYLIALHHTPGLIHQCQDCHTGWNIIKSSQHRCHRAMQTQQAYFVAQQSILHQRSFRAFHIVMRLIGGVLVPCCMKCWWVLWVFPSYSFLLWWELIHALAFLAINTFLGEQSL